MTTAIEGFFLKTLLFPFSIVSVFVLTVVFITDLLVKKEIHNEEDN